MSNAARDPRRDPRVGDILRDRNGQTIIVMPLGPGETRDLAWWRRSMRGAVIVKAVKRD